MSTTLQRDLSTGQQRLDLPLPATRPLLPLEAVMIYLDRDPEDIAMLIEQRYLRYSFDLRAERSDDGQLVRHSFPRVLVQSVREYAALSVRGDYRSLLKDVTPKSPADALRIERETRRVIESFLPHRKPVLRTPELCRVFSCTKEHVNNLICDGLIKATKAATVNTSAEITRASVIEFLLKRRMPTEKQP